MNRIFRVARALVLGGTLIGCASVHETYYLATYDPATDTRNYYRINVDGFSSAAKIKFSVGFYDKQAVERLFGEQVLQREYLGTEVDVFDADTGKRLADIGDQLARARASQERSEFDRLQNANATVSGLLIKYKIRLDVVGKLDDYQTYIDEISAAHEEAAKALEDYEDTSSRAKLATAHNRINKALVGLHAIRIAVDGDILVRFFDGAGNEMDVAAMAQVIFVANDVSRFAEAIRQLAEESEVEDKALDIVLGQRKQDAQRAFLEAAASEQQAAEASAALEEVLARLPAPSDPVPTSDLLRKALIEAAAKIADGPSSFQSGDDVRNYLEGREP